MKFLFMKFLRLLVLSGRICALTTIDFYLVHEIFERTANKCENLDEKPMRDFRLGLAESYANLSKQRTKSAHPVKLTTGTLVGRCSDFS